MISTIFNDKPSQWGLRGDPYLWEELKKEFMEISFIETEEEFLTIFREKYEAITNRSLDEDEYIYIERFSHGGMSTGQISPEFWREEALALLLERYNKLKETRER